MVFNKIESTKNKYTILHHISIFTQTLHIKLNIPWYIKLDFIFSFFNAWSFAFSNIFKMFFFIKVCFIN